MKGTKLSLGLAAIIAALSSTTFAYTVEGTVSDEGGQAVSGAKVSLLKEGKSAQTDASGKFSIHEDEVQPADSTKDNPKDTSSTAIRYLGQYNMIATAQVKVFDMTGHQVLNKYYTDASNLDMSKDLKSQGTYVAQVTIGNSTRMVKFNTNNKSINLATVPTVRGMLAKAAAAGEALQVIADGFDTLSVPLTSLDTNLTLTLKASSSEKQYAFGYALKNAPRPSKGCGKASTLQKTKSVENGDRFEMKVNNETREFFVTLPKNYDNTKPYKILFAMHCMGSNAEDFVHHAPDYDHPTPYYGQQQLDKEGNYIFVAPRGDTDGMPWSMTSDKDHKFFDQLLTTMEDNYCIDTTRVFVTGFSFGAMYTNSLAWDMQHRIRAVAVYAPVAEVIYLPKNAGKPIAWMAVHGKRDGTCQYSHDLQSTLPAILKNNGKASDGDSQFTDASGEKPEEFNGTAGHLCYDFKTVDERFPVKFCSWNGEHQWTAHDGGNTGVGQGWQNTWVPEEAHKFFEQF